jgi:iron complex outermembrane receptor protein
MKPFTLTAGLLIVLAAPHLGWGQEGPRNLSLLSLEELADVETTTSTRIPTELSKVPSAVFVITQEDIRRSGVRSLPEALRLAPGVQVARIDANKWAVGLRGFGSRLSRAMLVLLDGRAVYTPLFAGTYWEVQDTLLEDIERIEVVLGPGGTLWGANAVNGIVNIITKETRDTQGTLVAADVGGEERGAVRFRYGGRSGTESSYRAYGKFFARDSLFHAVGEDFDDWRMGQAGFRADWAVLRGKTLTLQGDAYRGTTGQRSTLTLYSPPSVLVLHQDATLSGGNVLGRLGGPAGASDVRLQWFYDRTNRAEPTFQEHRDTIDLDFQHRLPGLGVHQLLWGAGYRMSSGAFRGAADTLRFIPERRTDQLFTGFVQDDIEAVVDRVHVILGSKLEHNGYSGFEAQPSGRVLWTPTTRQTVAASITRAVRTPSRVEHDLEGTSLLSAAPVTTFSRLLPSKDFRAERLLAYEVQYRVQPASSFSLAVSTFFNTHDDLLSIEPGAPFVETAPPPPHVVVPIALANGIHGHSYGLESLAVVEAAAWWRLTGGYSYVQIDLGPDAGSGDTSTALSTEGSTPRHQTFVRSSMNLPARLELDWMFRALSSLPSPSQRVPRYQTSDIRLGWNVVRALTLAVVGQNLHEPHHLEFVSGGVRSEVQRSVFGSVSWQW